jgi:hypothetical protein
MTNNKFTITKRIAKHDQQAVIIVLTLLQAILSPGKVVKIDIEVLEN